MDIHQRVIPRSCHAYDLTAQVLRSTAYDSTGMRRWLFPQIQQHVNHLKHQLHRAPASKLANSAEPTKELTLPPQLLKGLELSKPDHPWQRD